MSDTARLEQAAGWLQRLRSAQNDEATLATWLAWCRADPANLEAFEKLQELWQAFDLPDVQAAAAELRGPETVRRAQRRAWMRRVLPIGLAAAVVIATVFWWVLDSRRSEVRTLTTAVAEHGSQILADGSHIDLGADTRIVTRYTNDERSIALESGEAFFKVNKDGRRPFVVNAGGVRVTAVGTAFTVRRGLDRTIVIVTEGVVRIAPNVTNRAGHEVQAVAGEEVTFTESSSSLTIARADPQTATSWREGVLKFVDEPLGSVVSRVNRYSTRRIALTDAHLATQSFTGTVYEGRIGDWLHALERVFPVRVVDDEGSEIRIEPR